MRYHDRLCAERSSTNEYDKLFERRHERWRIEESIHEADIEVSMNAVFTVVYHHLVG